MAGRNFFTRVGSGQRGKFYDPVGLGFWPAAHGLEKWARVFYCIKYLRKVRKPSKMIKKTKINFEIYFFIN